jgi:NAD(P)-dependent dehydrogenase (short-subunit alcohol dehydrogenase family)
MPETPTALIIGASRGLGLAMCAEYLKRGWRVMGTVRGAGSAELEALAAQSDGRLEIERVDINDPAQVAALAARLAGRRFALLFVNAGVSNGPSERVDAVSTKSFTEVMVTNALSPMRVIAALEGLVPAGGTIGAMSSGLGSVAANDRGGWEVYRASKAALNTLMRSFAARQAGDGRAMVVIAPGWVRTDMGGPAATLGIEDSIPKVVDTILGLAGKPGLQYLNYLGQTLRW